MTEIPARLQQLLDELDDDGLSEARWRSALEEARPLIDDFGLPELVEPFLIAGARRGWAE